MSFERRRVRTLVGRGLSLAGIGIAAVALLAAGGGDREGAAAEPSPSAAPAAAAGVIGVRDEATGELREPTPDELAALSAGLDPRLTRGRQGLQGVRNADGSWTLELGGRIVAASFGRIGEDGSVAVVCTHGGAPPAAPPDSGEAVR